MDHNGEHRFSCWIDGGIDTQFDRLINLREYKIRANQLDPNLLLQMVSADRYYV
jgi:hypothetical protein